MSAHRPKTAALMAYAEGLLSPEGHARVDRHLAGCEVCRRELAAAMLYEQMTDEAREAPAPEVDFDRMEMTLAREAERVSREMRAVRRRRPWPWVALAAAAAAALAVYAAWPAPEAPVATDAPRVEEPREEPAAAEPAPLAPVVTLAAGAAERLEAGEAAALLAGEELREGQSLRTGADGALHVRLSEGTGIALAAETELALSRAREDGVELSLARGRVDSAVAPLASGSTYVILCAGYRVEVRGTRFVVSYLDGVVGVDVAEGVVLVTAPDESATELTAPARWRSSGEAEGEPSAVEPRAVRGAEGAPVLVTIAHPELVRWEIDATTFTGGGPVRILLPAGEHEVRGWDARGRLFTALVPVSGAAVAIEPDALSPEAPRLRPGHLEPEEISRVVQGGQVRLRGCYERTLRDHPQVYGRLRMRVTVGVMGDVRRVSVLGADASETAQLRDCITRVASGWTFAPPGGPVTFELPLAFSSRP